MRVRGLKLLLMALVARSLRVAPHAGAWIETLVGAYRLELAEVAPHAGAWIETMHVPVWKEMSRRTPCGCVD